MPVKMIEDEMDQLKKRLAFLESRLHEIQHYCEHHFEGNSYYQKCVKCHKVEALYY